MAVVRFIGLALAGILVGLVFCCLAVGFSYLVAEGAGLLWPPLALVVYGLVLAGMTSVYLRFPTLARAVVSSGVGFAVFSSLGIALEYLLVFMFISGQFLRHWSLQFGGFAPQGGDYLAWTLYAVSWLLDNGLGNFGQIFGWDISIIHPINDTTKSLVWIYNVALEFLAIATVVRAVALVSPYWRESRRHDASALATDNQPGTRSGRRGE
jgi:hypothetical protein